MEKEQMNENNRRELISGLQAINCFHNHKIENDGKCYSKECMMNADEHLRRLIAKDGCKVYKRDEVQNHKESNHGINVAEAAKTLAKTIKKLKS